MATIYDWANPEDAAKAIQDIKLEEQNRIISLLQFQIEYYACRGWLYKQDEIVTPVLEGLIGDIQKGKKWDTAPIFAGNKEE